MSLDTKEIETEWHSFLAGTRRDEIWHWFEEIFRMSIAEDLLGL